MAKFLHFVRAILFVTAILLAGSDVFAEERAADSKSLDASKLVEEALEYWRGGTSYTIARMRVHRPTYERSMELVAWMKDLDNSLVRFTEPEKDAGNATLTRGEQMWSFTPKTNRIVKIPSSMMSQSWMGSDLSHRDLAKTDSIIRDYNHTVLKTEEQDGHTVYIVESIPKETAPVVWGKERLEIRDDYIILRHEFYDQDFKLIKVFTAEDIGPLGGRVYARKVRMENLEEKDEWTEMSYLKAKFDLSIPDVVFTQSNLRNPRDLDPFDD